MFHSVKHFNLTTVMEEVMNLNQVRFYEFVFSCLKERAMIIIIVVNICYSIYFYQLSESLMGEELMEQ